VEQRISISKDGTEIPYFIVMKKDIVLDGNNPTLCYPYGGFEVSLGPHYIATAGGPRLAGALVSMLGIHFLTLGWL